MQVNNDVRKQVVEETGDQDNMEILPMVLVSLSDGWRRGGGLMVCHTRHQHGNTCRKATKIADYVQVWKKRKSCKAAL